MLSLKDSTYITVTKATFSTDVSIDYQFAIVDTNDFDQTPGGKVDIFYEDDPTETESWFVCTSQTYTFSATIDAVLLYNIQIVDGVYISSTRHTYESWAKCVGTHRLSKD